MFERFGSSNDSINFGSKDSRIFFFFLWALHRPIDTGYKCKQVCIATADCQGHLGRNEVDRTGMQRPERVFAGLFSADPASAANHQKHSDSARSLQNNTPSSLGRRWKFNTCQLELKRRRNVPRHERAHAFFGNERRRPALVREHVEQRLDVFELGCQPGANHVVRARHDLDALAAQIGVRLVGCHEEGLARLQRDVVEQEGSETSDIAGVLLVQAEKELILLRRLA
mmetsp:Transcript_6519/g.17453  ORF Transcript_6519/g.17453 Transcript_6519/m.17453 type:complete len:227 (-) Transcript_6519:716-1396(-)